MGPTQSRPILCSNEVVSIICMFALIVLYRDPVAHQILVMCYTPVKVVVWHHGHVMWHLIL